MRAGKTADSTSARPARGGAAGVLSDDDSALLALELAAFVRHRGWSVRVRAGGALECAPAPASLDALLAPLGKVLFGPQLIELCARRWRNLFEYAAAELRRGYEHELTEELASYVRARGWEVRRGRQDELECVPAQGSEDTELVPDGRPLCAVQLRALCAREWGDTFRYYSEELHKRHIEEATELHQRWRDQASAPVLLAAGASVKAAADCSNNSNSDIAVPGRGGSNRTRKNGRSDDGKNGRGEDMETTAPSKLARAAPGTEVASAMKVKLEKPDAAAGADDVPEAGSPALSDDVVPVIYSEVFWFLTDSKGWKVVKGNGLVDWYYLGPGVAPPLSGCTPLGCAGVDFCTSQTELVHVVTGSASLHREYCTHYRRRFGIQEAADDDESHENEANTGGSAAATAAVEAASASA